MAKTQKESDSGFLAKSFVWIQNSWIAKFFAWLLEKPLAWAIGWMGLWGTFLMFLGGGNLVKNVAKYAFPLDSKDADTVAAVQSIVYALTTVGVGIVAYNKRLSQEVEQQIEKQREKTNILDRKIDNLINSVDANERCLETIKIGIFSKLLAYTPLYISEQLKFFEEEGLIVEIVPAGGDQKVALGIKSGNFDFGVCDPVFALHKSKHQKDNLKIVIPLVKRLDLTVVCRKDIKWDAQSIKILSYSKPSTTYAVAAILREQLQQENSSLEVEIVPKSPLNGAFNNPRELENLLCEADIFLLWNPASSILKSLHPDKFGILSYNRNAGANPWSVLNFDSQIEPNDYTWHPFSDENGKHKLMVSGMLTSEYMTENRPELCRKVFRALSRGLVRIEADKWKIDAEGNSQIVNIIKGSVEGAQYIDAAIIKSLVENHNLPNSPSLFPFVAGLYDYDPVTYTTHLQNLHRLWEIDASFATKIDRSVGATDDYLSYFAKFESKKT